MASAPTVAKALISSNSRLLSGIPRPVSKVSITMRFTISQRPARIIRPSAWDPTAAGMVRLKATIPRRLSRSWFQRWARPMATVVVRTPPAVPPGEPPISIRIIIICAVSGPMADIDTVLKPAVRVVTEWKKALSTRPPFSGPCQR